MMMPWKLRQFMDGLKHHNITQFTLKDLPKDMRKPGLLVKAHFRGLIKAVEHKNNRTVWQIVPDSVTLKENVHSRKIKYNGELRMLSEWSHIINIPLKILCQRLSRNWSIERAFETPVQKRKYAKGSECALKKDIA